jgi:LPXTG-site transpeptidase (sortase) family protein
MLTQMIQIIKSRPLKFIALWLLVFVVSFFILSFFGLVPEPKTDVVVDKNQNGDERSIDIEKKLSTITPSLPKRIIIDEIGVNVEINNPRSRKIDVLDNSLLSGAVRYPTSGLLGEKTNMLLFGHNSSLPVVRNTNFKAFNKLDKLKQGDNVSVFSSTHEFVYKVSSVEEAGAEDALVVFESDKREITLSTCNTFGDLNDRFVVKAELVDVISRL